MTGTTNFGVVADSNDPTHRLAFDIFVDRVAGFIGSYFVSLEGRVDALVFAGGIGEHSAKPWEVRNRLEQLYGDVSRIELFARTAAEGWECWGNQCDSSVQLIAGRVA